MSPPRHFLDLSELPAGTLRGILDDSRRMKADGHTIQEIAAATRLSDSRIRSALARRSTLSAVL